MSEAPVEIGALTARQFEQIRVLAYEKVGLDLKHGKQALVSARVGKKIRELNFRTFQDYYQHVMEDSTGGALISLIDALTTNHTAFFRETAHFDFLRSQILPRLRGRQWISIWSAACSSGEEPYSIAFCLLDELGESAMAGIHILATDISTKALEKATRAIYPAERTAQFSAAQLQRYLLRGEREWKDWYMVKPAIKKTVECRRLNLTTDRFSFGPFPLIFCRNVMIYFDKPTQERLVNRLADCLEPGGYLFVGHSESLNGLNQPLTHVQPAVYKKRGELSRESSRLKP